MDNVVGIAAAVGVAIGIGIWTMRTKKQGAMLAEKIRKELAAGTPLKLPELVTRLGMKDSFMNRGRLMNALNPMVARGEIHQEEPPGTTMKNRLDVLTFSLKSAKQ